MEKQFIREQEKLLASIQLKNEVSINELKYVAGVDVAYWKEDETEYAVCCIVAIDYKTQAVVERQCCRGTVNVPYIPGCLAFREIEIVMNTIALLENNIDLYVFDGNGYLHPRHMGLATHAGILLNKPSIGIAKSYFKVKNIDYAEPENEVFSFQDIVLHNEIYGRAVRTHKNVKPIFVSIGNKIDIDTATNIAMSLVTKDSHIPLPTRYADIMTHEMRKKYQQK